MRAVAIISNEEILDVPLFYRDVHDTEFHAMKVQEFCDKYHLGVTFKSLGIEDGYYGGVIWQTKLASLGHTVICHGDPTIVYLPNYLSENQYAWFLKYKDYFKKQRKNLSYVVIDSALKIIESDDTYSKNNTFSFLYHAIENCRGGGYINVKGRM